MAVVISLDGLQTESRNPKSTEIDRVSTIELCKIINREDASLAGVVHDCIGVISEAIDALTERVRRGGRVIYIGAGTSGRLGVLDASELPPTYSAPASQFVGLIAGGDVALRNAMEGAEDDTQAAVEDLSRLNLDPDVDSLIGIASSGRTPYVLAGLRYAKSLGCTTIGVACVEPSAIGDEGNADFMIAAVTGPEVVTGSTRMKAGTATKMILNMISTGVMIKVGKTYGNMMVDLKATNLKLKQRAKNLLRLIGGTSTPKSDEALEALLVQCDGSVKLAAATLILGSSVTDARESLERNGGLLAKVIDEAQGTARKPIGAQHDETKIVLCVDAGASSCKAVIIDSHGVIGRGESGPCNVSSMSISSAISTISLAIQHALTSFPVLQHRPLDRLPISQAWVGIAGYDRPSMAPKVSQALAEAYGLTDKKTLRVSSDIDLLTGAVANDALLESAVVLVAGTGSIAMSFHRHGGDLVRTGRAGGWGCLLGDDGSGYGIGREGLRNALSSLDKRKLRKRLGKEVQPLGTLVARITEHFALKYPGHDEDDLLSTILVPEIQGQQATNAGASTVKRIAETARIVLAACEADPAAKLILEKGAHNLTELVMTLLVEQDIEPSRTALLVAGGLMQDEAYRQMVQDNLLTEGINFSLIRPVEQPALAGAQYLHSVAFGLRN